MMLVLMTILTLLTSRSWLVLRLSTGWGGRGRDIVSRRAENSVLDCYSVLFLCTDLFDTNQPPNFCTFIWHRPHLKSLLCLGHSCFCQLGASCSLVVISFLLWIVIIGWYLLTPSFVHWLISIGCWWCLLLTTSRSQFTRWSDDLTDGSLVLSHIEVDQSHLADYAEH